MSNNETFENIADSSTINSPEDSRMEISNFMNYRTRKSDDQKSESSISLSRASDVSSIHDDTTEKDYTPENTSSECTQNPGSGAKSSTSETSTESSEESRFNSEQPLKRKCSVEKNSKSKKPGKKKVSSDKENVEDNKPKRRKVTNESNASGSIKFEKMLIKNVNESSSDDEVRKEKDSDKKIRRKRKKKTTEMGEPMEVDSCKSSSNRKRFSKSSSAKDSSS